MRAISNIDAMELEALDEGAEKLAKEWFAHRHHCRACFRGVPTLGGDEFRCADGQIKRDRWRTAESRFSRQLVEAAGR